MIMTCCYLLKISSTHSLLLNKVLPKIDHLKETSRWAQKQRKGGVVETEKRKSKVTLDMLFAVLRKNYYKLLDITD